MICSIDRVPLLNGQLDEESLTRTWGAFGKQSKREKHTPVALSGERGELIFISGVGLYLSR